MKKIPLQRISVFSSIIAALFIILVLVCDGQVKKKATGNVFSNLNELPENKVGLVLGASRNLPNGNTNLYFRYRIEAAKALIDAGKIQYIIVSGDNHIHEYNEPEDMRQELIALGVPHEIIYLDYAGFRTHDSVIRCKEIFGQQNFTIISQKFHNERAVFIAQSKGLNAVAFNAQDVRVSQGFKTLLREKLARVKLFLDLFILNTKPKFMGDPVLIGE